MLLGADLAERGHSPQNVVAFSANPLALHCLDLFASTVGMHFVQTKRGLPSLNPGYGPLEDALLVVTRGFRYSFGLSVAGFILLPSLLLNDRSVLPGLLNCGVLGISNSSGLVFIWVYILLGRRASESTRAGRAASIVYGLENTAIMVIAICMSVAWSYSTGLGLGLKDSHGKEIGGLYGTAIMAAAMLCSGVYSRSMDGFWLVAESADRIIEVSQSSEEPLPAADGLCAKAEAPKAKARIHSVVCASLACFLLFNVLTREANSFSPGKLSVDVLVPEVFLSGLLGSLTVLLFSAWSVQAAESAAQETAKEVSRQLRENPGILTNTSKPDYSRCIQVVAERAAREMLKPGLLAVLSPVVLILLFCGLGRVRGIELLGAKCLCAFLIFSACTAALLALFSINKTPRGAREVRGPAAQANGAADTAGPPVHILLKLLPTAALVLWPLISD